MTLLLSILVSESRWLHGNKEIEGLILRLALVPSVDGGEQLTGITRWLSWYSASA